MDLGAPRIKPRFRHRRASRGCFYRGGVLRQRHRSKETTTNRQRKSSQHGPSSPISRGGKAESPRRLVTAVVKQRAPTSARYEAAQV